MDYLLDLQDKTKGELEARVRILPPKDFNGKKVTITYYRSSIYNDITFRKRSNNGEIEIKELVERSMIKGIPYYLSIEKVLHSKISLVEVEKRIVYREKIKDNPLVEIIKHNDSFTLEVEFDKSNYIEAIEIAQSYRCPFYPLPKPKEITTRELASKLTNKDDWMISFKADGLHVIVLEDKNKNKTLLYDSGKIDGEMIDYIFVYEAELVNNELLYFDCIMYNGLILNEDYDKRLKYIDKIKDAWNFNEAEKVINYVPQFPSDGFILTNKKTDEVYKSKFVSTTDYRYKNGYLFLENEKLSTRVPKTKYNYITNRIYEFDNNLCLVRERKDKQIANYKVANESNQLYRILNGIGTPLLRNYHNIVKSKLLDILDEGILLDIGSGKGGDINKWNKFKKVYAIDPNLNMRTHKENIIEFNTEAKNLPKFAKYDYVSIFFVPWDNSFIDILNNAKKAVLILMNNAFEYKCDQFTCTVKNDDITLEIPESETAINVNEKIIETKNLFKRLKLKVEKIDINIPDNLHKNEKILASMYTYYYLHE